jgi:hypothetical protein
MPGRDLGGGGQMFEAIRLDGPGWVIAQDVPDPSLLGTGEHGAAIVAERAAVGQQAEVTPALGVVKWFVPD